MHHRTDSSETWQDRIDRGPLLASHMRADGTLLVEGFAAREGIAEYRIGGKVIRELVRADTLKKAAAGLARTTVTLNHPDQRKHPDWVTPDNIAELGVGDTDGEVSVEDGGFVRVKMAVRRRDALDAIRKGTHRELSPGYKARIDATPGVHPVHGPYDQEQVERTYNHLAIVDQARFGSDIHLRADSGVATTVISSGSPASGSPASIITPSRGAGMNPQLLMLCASLGCTQRFDSEDAAIEWLSDKLRTQRADSARADQERADTLAAVVTERDAAKVSAAAEKTRADTEKTRADAAASELATLKAAEKTRADATERTALEGLAKPLKVVPEQHPTNPALKKAVAAAHLKRAGRELRADATDAYLDAVIDDLRDARKDSAEGRDAGAAAWTPNTEARSDAAPAPKRSTMSARWSGQPMPRGGE